MKYTSEYRRCTLCNLPFEDSDQLQYHFKSNEHYNKIKLMETKIRPKYPQIVVNFTKRDNLSVSILSLISDVIHALKQLNPSINLESMLNDIKIALDTECINKEEYELKTLQICKEWVTIID